MQRSRPLLVALTVLLAACGLAAARPPVATPRPLLVFVHGRGHLDRDSSAVRIEWERALRMGAREIQAGPLFDERDVRLVWYADVLDPTSDEGCRRVDDEPASRARTEDSSFGGGARLLLGALAAALEEPKGRREVRGLLGDLLYLADPWKRCGVERRLATVLAEAASARRPVVLVTHSLGAAVAYRHLRDHTRGAPVQRWVTLGAPLGDPELRALLLGESEATLRMPARVRSWVNVVREGDPFASALAPLFDKGSRITDVVRRTSGGDPHDLAAYLKDEEAARAIVWAWCDAFGSSTKPVGCGKVGEDVK